MQLKRILLIIALVFCWGSMGCLETGIELSKAEAALLSDPYREIVQSGKWYIRYSLDERKEAERTYNELEEDPMIQKSIGISTITKKEQENMLKFLEGMTRETVFAVDGERRYEQDRHVKKGKLWNEGTTTICKDGKIYRYGTSFTIGNEQIGWSNKKEGLVIQKQDVSKQQIMILYEPVLPRVIDILLPKEVTQNKEYGYYYEFIKKGQETLDGIEYDYEEYGKKNPYISETEIIEKIWVYFKEGVLKKFKMDYAGPVYDVIEFKGDVDKSLFEFSKGFKFYAVPKNDMEGLLKKKVLVEKY